MILNICLLLLAFIIMALVIILYSNNIIKFVEEKFEDFK